tara:strand:+ start:562 stop:984 length:423 start_codon:yes stop_codon:yes gene_type:complete
MTYSFLIPIFTQGILFLRGQLNTSNERKREIINAIDSALIRTRHHIANSRTKDKERIASTELYEKWNNVANLIEPYDKENAEIFYEKSKYWLNPGQWIEQVYDEKNRNHLKMALDEVNRELWKLKTIWNIDTKINDSNNN